MTYHYRIYTFQNGLGETVFRAKPVHRFLPQWAIAWVDERIFSIKSSNDWFDKWRNRDGVMAAINGDARDRARDMRLSQGKKLKLVITEDVPVEVSS